jgi:hypothetical protein
MAVILQETRERHHHRQAQLIAAGRPMTEVAVTTQTTADELWSRMADPAFRELVSYYRAGGTYLPEE